MADEWLLDWRCCVLRSCVTSLQDTNYWKRKLWAAHDRVECEVMQGMHDQGLPVVKVRIASEKNVAKMCTYGRTWYFTLTADHSK